MADENGVLQTFKNVQEWNEFGERLTAILKEVTEKTGEAALYVTEEGEFFIHPDVSRKLDEPGNEGPLELLRFMKRNGIGDE
jgi:hypothetical protein